MLNKNILLIDDDSDDAELFIEAVNALHKNIVCRTTNNPLKALEELKNADELPDFVFVDFSMPGLNGAEFIEKVKEEKRLGCISIILMSTHTVEVMRKLTRQFDTLQYMTKPSSFQELVAMLDEVL